MNGNKGGGSVEFHQERYFRSKVCSYNVTVAEE
jgi:hypothetical protein